MQIGRQKMQMTGAWIVRVGVVVSFCVLPLIAVCGGE